MDFIENCDVVVSPTHVVDDDVFVNLDAFDMLGEFPDLESLESGHASLLDVNPSEAGRSGHGKSQSNSNAHQQSQQHSHHNGNSHQEGISRFPMYSPIIINLAARHQGDMRDRVLCDFYCFKQTLAVLRVREA